MKNYATIQGILSIAAIICLAVGWFKLFSPEINDFLYRKLFYVILGLSFIFQGPIMANPKLNFPMIIAGSLCIIGAFIPEGSPFVALKTIGLLAGVAMSFFNRTRTPRSY